MWGDLDLLMMARQESASSRARASERPHKHGSQAADAGGRRSAGSSGKAGRSLQQGWLLHGSDQFS